MKSKKYYYWQVQGTEPKSLALSLVLLLRCRARRGVSLPPAAVHATKGAVTQALVQRKLTWQPKRPTACSTTAWRSVARRLFALPLGAGPSR